MRPSPHPHPRVLLVEDAPEFARAATALLERAHFAVDVTGSGEQALRAAAATDYDLVVLDVTLPDTDGFDVCRRLRTFSDTYVLMVTGRGSEVDRVVGLRLGADDYITKPYSPAELDARIAAVRRRPRTRPRAGGQRLLDGLVLDLPAREVRADEDVVPLTRTEFDLLVTLADAPGRVLTRADLLAAVWGHQQGDERLVDVHVGNLRRKLRPVVGHARHVQTVRGVGYRLGVPVSVPVRPADLADISTSSSRSLDLGLGALSA